jgi:CheY-like chemotaxis protein
VTENVLGLQTGPAIVFDTNLTMAYVRTSMSPQRLTHLTIVVVEDDNDTRRYLTLYLDYSGAKVVPAGNAWEALEAIKTFQPDVVVSDLMMPGRDGFALLRDIRELGPGAGGEVPVIAMSAIVTRADRARILSAGFQECLPKPFGPDQLLRAILAVLGE